jgi:hypothetical protein
MTGIVVSRRDGIARAPDGTQWRVHRGKTLADARHPVVVAYPGDWMPVEIELDMPGAGVPHPPCAAEREVDELRNELAETEELAEHRGAELQRLQDGLEDRGIVPPIDEVRSPGWLVNWALATLDSWRATPLVVVEEDAPQPVTEAETPPAPRPPRRKSPAAPR